MENILTPPKGHPHEIACGPGAEGDRTTFQHECGSHFLMTLESHGSRFKV